MTDTAVFDFMSGYVTCSFKVIISCHGNYQNWICDTFLCAQLLLSYHAGICSYLFCNLLWEHYLALPSLHISQTSPDSFVVIRGSPLVERAAEGFQSSVILCYIQEPPEDSSLQWAPPLLLIYYKSHLLFYLNKLTSSSTTHCLKI